ncbi:MAG TPA: sulfite exporter TauE/SafE family protein [Deinococcales bacterium]|nr:sulfite exporter TauE/SafE family protein [Deinococcales bacterium]
MTAAELLFPGATGLFAGVLGAMLGLGGGIVVVPVFALFSGRFLGADMPIQEAVAASQIGVLSVAVASSATYLGRNLVRVRTAYLLSPYTVFGGIAGSFLGLVLDERVVAFIFAALMIYTGVEMLRGARRPETTRSEPSRWSRPAVSAAGLMSGLLGVGGGTVQVPVLNVLVGIPFREAIATSTFMMGLTALANALIYFANGSLVVTLAAPLAVGILLGARVGALVSKWVPVSALRVLFAGLVFYTAYDLVVSHL